MLLTALLLAACTGAPQLSVSPTASPVTVATPGSPSPSAPTSSPATAVPSQPASIAPSPSAAADGWRTLLTGAWLADPFAVAVAREQAELDALWQDLAQTAPPPAVDFTRELVIFLGMSGSSSCPEELERLVVDFEQSHVYGQWAQRDPNQACTDDLQAQGVLIAVDRALLPTSQFLLSLREEPICADCPEKPDQRLVDPAG